MMRRLAREQMPLRAATLHYRLFPAPGEGVLALSFLMAMTASAGPWVIWLLIRTWACPCWTRAMGLADRMPAPNQSDGLAVIHVLHEVQTGERQGQWGVRDAAS
jgi:hypothetical protein